LYNEAGLTWTNLSLRSEFVRYATPSRQVNPVFHAADEQRQSNYLSSDFRRSRRFHVLLALSASIIRRETLRVGDRKRAANAGFILRRADDVTDAAVRSELVNEPRLAPGDALRGAVRDSDSGRFTAAAQLTARRGSLAVDDESIRTATAAAETKTADRMISACDDALTRYTGVRTAPCLNKELYAPYVAAA